jgi:hypothetical protein
VFVQERTRPSLTGREPLFHCSEESDMYDPAKRIYATDNSGRDGEGICAAIAMAYCADFARGKREQATQRAGAELDLLASYFQESMAASRARHDMSRAAIARGQPGEVDTDAFTFQDQHLASIFRVGHARAAVYPAGALFGYLPAINQAWYLSHDQKLAGQGGHAIAVSKGATDEHIYLLDPNHGLYRYTTPASYQNEIVSVFATYMSRTWGRAIITVLP